MRERVFEKLFESAEIAKFTPEQVRSYEDSLKYYRDLKNSLDTAKEEGKEEGIVIGKEIGREIGIEEGKEIAKIEFDRKALLSGLSDTDIIAFTGLSLEELHKLR